MERNRSRLNLKGCKRSVLEFFQEKQLFDQAQSKFADVKERFYSDMEDYFKHNSVDADGKLRIGVDDMPNIKTLVVNRVQSTKLEFDLVKLEKALGKELSKAVITKRYEIIDIDGLVAYLKECGVDPKIFKSFLSVSRGLNASELDRLADIGKITQDQIEGCYTIKKQKPYFTVNVGRGQSDEEGK